MARRASTFQQLVNTESVAALEAELKADRRRYGELFMDYGRIREELETLNDAIERQEKVLEALRSALPPDGQQATSSPDPDGEVAMTKREIATEILKGSIQPMFPRQVRDVAVERGWIADTQAAGNQLSVAMSKAARAGFFERDREGRYSLSEYQ